MNSKKRTLTLIITGFSLSLIYIFLAITNLNTEYHLVPEWKIDVTNPQISEISEKTPVIPFKLGKTLGYFTEDGKVSNFKKFDYKASISKDFYTIYNQDNSSADYFTPDGRKTGTIKLTGFPHIAKDKIFCFLPGGSSFCQVNEDGSKKWEYDAACPITAFNASETVTVVGYANGIITEFDANGSVVQKFAPGGSDIPVILGTAVSSDGKYIASVSGQNRQRFLIAKNDGSHIKIIFHEFLDSKGTSQSLVKFSSDDKTVFFNADNLFGIADIQKEESKHIKIDGKAISVKELENNIVVLTKSLRNYVIYIIEKETLQTEKFEFTANSAFIETMGNNLYIGKNSTISKINLQKK